MKSNIIFLVLILLLMTSCATYLNRYKLDKQNQIYWDYYHSVDYCRRIELFEFISKDKYMESWLVRKQGITESLFKGKDCKHDACYFPFTEDNMYDYKKRSNYYEFISLHNDNRNSFYGYIYHDIKNKSKDKTELGVRLTGHGTNSEENYLYFERPPVNFTYKEFEDALLRWRKSCGCDTTQN